MPSGHDTLSFLYMVEFGLLEFVSKVCSYVYDGNFGTWLLVIFVWYEHELNGDLIEWLKNSFLLFNFMEECV